MFSTITGKGLIALAMLVFLPIVLVWLISKSGYNKFKLGHDKTYIEATKSKNKK